MPQVFHRSSNSIARLSIIGAAVTAALIGAIVYIVARSPLATGQHVPPAQPVPFSHAHHSGGDGIDCRYCHQSAEYSAVAGVPPTETCVNCHKQIWLNSPNLRPVRESERTGQPIQWVKVHDLPDFVYFNHSIHIKKGVGCSTCHGEVNRMQLTWQVAPLNMGWCVECHSQPERFVRPRSEIYNMQWQPPANQLELGRRLVDEYDIQKKVYCDTCHR
ncbi:MAG: cytochrome c family protein [Chloroflexota bacterium]|nr:cytochrome c family protein [Chloroflexota bacterium]